MSITLKPEAYFQHFQKLHSTKPITVDVLNVANPDALPAPLIVSKRDSTNPNVNKLVVGLFNQGIDRLVVGGPNLTGIYINFSDLMSVADMRRIKVSIEGSTVHTELSRQKVNPVGISPEELNSEDRDPSIPPPANNQHLGAEPILYIWPEKEIEIRPQETLLITLANVVSDFRPALRYLNVSWDMNRKAFNSITRQADSILEGLQQVSIQLLRPADYAEPPFPLVAHWLNNNNLIYTAADDTTTLKNTLDFAISNVDIQPFRLDCNKHSRGVPYFELIMVGKLPGDEGNFSTAVADAADLVLAQIPDTTKNEELNPLWRVNKRIQGPIVKWEIRPDMNFNPGADDEEEKNLHHKTLLGTDRNATITFRISELRSKLEDGVALVKFRYYNMPDHDDGQIVLFLEKRRISTGGNMIAQLDKFENEVASPLRWRQEKVANVPTTRVVIGDLIEGTDGEADRQLEVDLTVLGDTSVRGILNVGDSTPSLNGEGPAAQKTQLKVAGDAELSGNVTTPALFTTRTNFLAGQANIAHHTPLDQHANAIAAIRNIIPKYYRPKVDPTIPVSSKNNPHGAKFGFIAEEVMTHLPLLVVAGKNEGERYIDHPAMTALLWQGIRDQQQQIDSLNQQVSDLRDSIVNIIDKQARINQLERQIASAEEDALQLGRSINSNKSELRSVNAQLSDPFQVTALSFQGRLDDVLRRKVSLESAVVRQNSQLNALKNHIANLKAQLEAVKNS